MNPFVIIGQPTNDFISLCEVCPKPGACCKDFVLDETVWYKNWRENAQKMVSDQGFPFTPSGVFQRYYDRESRRYYAEITFRCKNLNEATGRCMDYENRPQLCRDYVPASDALCVLGAQKTYDKPPTPKNHKAKDFVVFDQAEIEVRDAASGFLSAEETSELPTT